MSVAVCAGSNDFWLAKLKQDVDFSNDPETQVCMCVLILFNERGKGRENCYVP